MKHSRVIVRMVIQETEMLKPASKFNGTEVHIGDKVVKIGGEIPELLQGEKLIRYTNSVCPYCERLLPAIIVERENKLYIRKKCPEHGVIEDLYYGDASMYYKFMKYAEEGRGTYPYVPVTAPCPFSCGLCSLHKNHTALLNIVVTNRCNLSCWYCFFYADKVGYVYEPSIDEIRNQVRQVKKQNVTIAVQLTGGEPLMRDDLVDVIKVLKEEGVRHIQLNTEGVAIAEVYLENPDLAVKWVRDLREAGVNTVYLSFDGVTPKTNPKNHYEIPFIFDAFRKAGMTSVVLVPTVIKTVNDHELGKIVEFAARNRDIVRSVNFQPVSLVGRLRMSDVNRFRITIPDVINLVEEQTRGMISKNSWYPIPVAAKFAKFIEAVTKKEQFYMANHIACGAATYIFVEENNGKVIYHPVTEYIDVEGFIETLDNLASKVESKGKVLTYIQLLSLLRKLPSFIKKDELPTGTRISSLIRKVLLERNYDALGEFHYNTIFLGIMHFMDQYNYDVERVMRCNIHYALPDGRIVPFCAYNVLNDVYKDYALKKHSVPIEEWAKTAHPHRYGVKDKHIPDIRRYKEHQLYVNTYKYFMEPKSN